MVKGCGGEPGGAAVISREWPGSQCGGHLGVAAASSGARRGGCGVLRPRVAARKKKTLFWFLHFF